MKIRLAAFQFALFLFPLTACFSRTYASNREKPVQADGVIRPSALAGAEEAYLPEIFPSSHASNLIVLHNRDILCFYFSGKEEGASNVAIVMSRLPYGSHRWMKPIVVDHHAGKSMQNPVPFEPSAGHLWLLHTTQEAGKGENTAKIYRQESNDNGKTWSYPAVLFGNPGSYDRNKIVVMKANEWMLPMYYMPSESIVIGANGDYSAMQITMDHGLQWQKCVIPHSHGLVQPSAVKLAANEYLALLRSRDADWIYRTTSTDGRHWTVPRATVLPNNNASIQLTRLENGHLVLAFNNVQVQEKRGQPAEGPRRPLSVALSVDGGKTWPWVRDVEIGRAGEEYSYPSIVQAQDGEIYLSFTYRRTTIKVMSFWEDWVKHGTTEGKYKPAVGIR